jgi:hypothetical protein
VKGWVLVGVWVLKVNVFVTNMTGERLWEVEKDLPAQIQIAVNINVLAIEEQSDGTLRSPFVFTVNFTPAIAQISIKGRARIQGDKSEVQKILQEQKEKKVPPPQILQAISSTAIAEAILISKTIGIPPPLPPIPAPPADQAQKAPDTRYA